ncbi:ribose-phosphate diphosphokinase [Candidatus Saccharibacteria bacterium]|nr:ribose-phosphate diphosphokinase [Candidatus Saccharibacteria bacterium]
MIPVAKRNMQIISGRTHPALAQQVAEALGIHVTPIELSNFANGEIYCKLSESVRSDDVFIFQSHGKNVNESILEQVIMIDAAKRADARSITAVCPFLGYARQDRKAGGREPISARLIVDMLATAGADRIMSVDLHSGQAQGFFNGPFDHLIAMPILKKYVHDNFNSEDLVIVSPDAGRAKSAERYSSALGCSMAIIHKNRSTKKRNTVEAKYLIGEVKDKICVIIDDMIDTAGTICAAADLLAENGAKEVYGVTTHGIFSDPALKRIEESAFTSVVATDTLPLITNEHTSKIVMLPIAPLIASAIEAIFSGESLSALFDGQNQM